MTGERKDGRGGGRGVPYGGGLVKRRAVLSFFLQEVGSAGVVFCVCLGSFGGGGSLL